MNITGKNSHELSEFLRILMFFTALAVIFCQTINIII